MKQLIRLKTVVTEIYTLESNNSKIQPKQRKNTRNKKITNLYKKNMK